MPSTNETQDTTPIVAVTQPIPTARRGLEGYVENHRVESAPCATRKPFGTGFVPQTAIAVIFILSCMALTYIFGALPGVTSPLDTATPESSHSQTVDPKTSSTPQKDKPVPPRVVQAPADVVVPAATQSESSTPSKTETDRPSSTPTTASPSPTPSLQPSSAPAPTASAPPVPSAPVEEPSAPTTQEPTPEAPQTLAPSPSEAPASPDVVTTP